MSMIVRRLLLVALGGVLGGLLCGLAVFGWSVEKLVSAEEEILQLRRELMEKDLHTRARFGSYGAAACDLRDYILLISVMCPKLECRDPKAVVRGLGLTYARLGSAASRSGRAEDSKAFLKLARGTLLAAGERPDDKQLLEYWDGMDKAWDEENAQVCPFPPDIAPARPETHAH